MTWVRLHILRTSSAAMLGLLSLAGAVSAQPQSRRRAAPPVPVVIRSKAPATTAVQTPDGGGHAPAPVVATGPEVAGVVPVGGVGVASSPRAVGTTLGVAKVGGADEARAFRLSLLLQQVTSGPATVDGLTSQGKLSAEDARWILSERIDPWGTIRDKPAVEVRRSLAALVWRKASEQERKQFAVPQVLPRTLRLWMADYLSSIDDESTVAISEQILKDTQLPVDGNDARGDNPLVFQALERLAWHHQAVGNREAAARAWERVGELHRDAGWWTVHASWGVQELGDDNAEQKLYEQMVQSGHIVLRELGQLGQVQLLINQRRTDEARRRLSNVTMVGTPEIVQVKQWSLIGQLHYASGDFTAARSFIEKAMTKYRSLSTEQRSANISYRVHEDAERLQWIEQWRRIPLYASPTALQMAVTRGSAKTVSLKSTLCSYDPAFTATATCADPRVKVTVSSWRHAGQFYARRELLVSLDPKDLAQSFNTVLTIRSPQFPDAHVDVPLYVEAVQPVHLSTSRVFFGIVQPGELKSRTLKTSAQAPFRILKVELDDPALQVDVRVGEVSKEHSVELKLKAQPSRQLYEGRVRLTTDLPSQEVILLPYMALVR